jgi:hypothetical protein
VVSGGTQSMAVGAPEKAAHSIRFRNFRVVKE